MDMKSADAVMPVRDPSEQMLVWDTESQDACLSETLNKQVPVIVFRTQGVSTETKMFHVWLSKYGVIADVCRRHEAYMDACQRYRVCRCLLETWYVLMLVRDTSRTGTCLLCRVSRCQSKTRNYHGFLSATKKSVSAFWHVF